MRANRYLVLALVLLFLAVTLLALPAVIASIRKAQAPALVRPVTSTTIVPTPTRQTHTPTPSAPTSTPTPTLSPSSTPLPSPTQVLPTGTKSPTPPARVLIEGMRHERQGWSNCGPTTLAMARSYWGYQDWQFAIAPILKPDPEDKHVGIHQMADTARGLGLNAAGQVGGTIRGLQRLLAAGFPVVIESWYVRDALDQLGHYRLVIGYNDTTQRFDLYDSLYDPPTTMGYQELYELWRVFNWTYLVTAPAERWQEATALASLATPDVEPWGEALERATAEAGQQPDSCVAYADCSDWVTFSWFTVGTNLTALGRHTEAAEAYDKARANGLHYSVLWYQFGPYESYYETGRYDDIIELATATLATAENLEESYLWRGGARLADGDPDGARSDFATALAYHPAWQPARTALDALDALTESDG